MTNRKRIVLATIGSLGDLHPMMALAVELQRREHDPVIASTEAYRAKVETAGIGFHPLRPNGSPEDPELLRHIMDLKKGPEFIIRRLFMPRLREMYDDLAAAAHDADFLIAGEVVFAAPLVAEKFNLRWATAILSPSSFFSVYDPSVIAQLPFSKYFRNAGPFFHRALIGLGQWIARDWGKPINRLRAELGLRQTRKSLFNDKYSPYLNLAIFSSVLGTPQRDWAPNTVQTGFVFYDRQPPGVDPSAALNAFLDAGGPPIVFTLGSAAVFAAGNFYEESIEAARKLGRRALLLVGKNRVRQGLPDSIAAFDYAPYSEVLPRAACVVHQGGIGTTAQVLRAGVPQLVMPYSFDQPDNAARVARLGVARTIGREEYTAGRAADHLAALLGDPAYAERAEEVARKVRAEEGLRESCDAIEKQVRLAAQAGTAAF